MSSTSFTIPVGDLVIRERRDSDVVPDVSSPWDNWPPSQGAGPAHDLQRGVIERDGRILGTVSWHATHYGPGDGSRAWNLGIALAPEHRGYGHGTRVQRALALHLLQSAHRVEASTDVENLAEQRSLEKAGFHREGILRGAQYRADNRHHNLVVYSIIRDDEGSPTSTA